MAAGKREDAKTVWQVKREASYEKLIRSAMYRFYERGYAATRVEDIVAGTGYTSGAFYLHFKNKADCFWHVIDYRHRRRQGWVDFLDGLDPATTDLETVIVRALDALSPDQGLSGWALVMVEHFQEHRDDPSVAERFAELYRIWHDDQIAFVQRLQHQGWVDPTRDAATIALQLLSFVAGLEMHTVVFSIDDQAFRRAQLDGILRILSSQGDSI